MIKPYNSYDLLHFTDRKKVIKKHTFLRLLIIFKIFHVTVDKYIYSKVLRITVKIISEVYYVLILYSNLEFLLTSEN